MQLQHDDVAENASQADGKHHKVAVPRVSVGTLACPQSSRHDKSARLTKTLVVGIVACIEAGKRADLLILDGNLLDDIRNIRRTHAVIANGAMYAPATLWRLAGFMP